MQRYEYFLLVQLFSIYFFGNSYSLMLIANNSLTFFDEGDV